VHDFDVGNESVSAAATMAFPSTRHEQR
jgi:hypothetical protein